MKLDLDSGLVDQAQWCESPNQDQREHGAEPEALIIHCISLPPGEYGGGQIRRFFQNQLNANEHPYFEGIAHLTVSSHFLIERQGLLVQFVPTHKRAWHAGESVCLQQPKVNNFSIGVELEGLDTDANGFTAQQYATLGELTHCLKKAYPSLTVDSIFAHSDIAPGRKPDPGPFFDWEQYFTVLNLAAN